MPDNLSDASDIDQPLSERPTTSADLQPHYPGEAKWEDKAACRLVDALNKRWKDLESKISAIPKDDQGTFASLLTDQRSELQGRLREAYLKLQDSHMNYTIAQVEHGNQDEEADTSTGHAPSADNQTTNNYCATSIQG